MKIAECDQLYHCGLKERDFVLVEELSLAEALVYVNSLYFNMCLLSSHNSYFWGVIYLALEL